MMGSNEPVVLELAPLPREQMGPFLILGIEKDADKEQVEAAWANRVIRARKNQIRMPLEDINWAREVLNDLEQRIKADATSLNVDTMDGVVRRLERAYGGEASWQPLDVEKPLTEYVPAADIPDCEQVRQAIVVPPLPQEAPAVVCLLEQLAQNR